jgi:nucleotide-binding universal stress UspA family protein
VPVLIEESGNARLIVLGSRGLGGFSGILVGSTAVALVVHGHCPVAVIRGTKPGEAPPFHGPVVVGVDGSPASDSALAMAFDEASWRGADLVAVHTWLEFSSDSADAYARQFLVDWDAIETRERELLAQRLLAGRRSTRMSRWSVWSLRIVRCAACWNTPPTRNCWWSAAGDTAGCPGCCSARPPRR